MSVCVVEIFNHRNDDKSEHYKYFPLFATDKYVKYAKNGMYHIITINERKAFDVMNADFLDYVLLKSCHSLSDIAITPFKTYAQIDEENQKIGRIKISDRTVGQGHGERPTMISSPFRNVVFMDCLLVAITGKRTQGKTCSPASRIGRVNLYNPDIQAPREKPRCP